MLFVICCQPKQTYIGMLSKCVKNGQVKAGGTFLFFENKRLNSILH